MAEARTPILEASTSRLPTKVRPRKYTLRVKPNLDQFTFQGNESIDINVMEPTQEIVLNALELEIASATLHCGGSTINAESITLDEDRQTATLSFGQRIPTGDARLDISFTGILNDNMHGFYRSEYTNPEGETRHLATTQFETADARRCFPCWDEPLIKATFEVALTIPSDLTAVSNTSVQDETETEPGLKLVRFGETPVMSTYLLAFTVGDLTSIQQQTDGTTISIWTTRGKEEQGRFALDTSVKLLSFFNDYFGIPYPLEKLDHIAIPDFAAGAMENWGAITYRETALLVDPDNSSAGTRQRVAEVVAHEMAHMWFGDLVTMEWWDDLWLNESFASWMGTKAVDWLFPEWQMWTQFVNMDTTRALSLDGLKNSHPIEQEVKDPAEVSQLFDAISYAKGASLIRMLEQYLGPETFQRGLQQYIRDHQYDNARTEDLWHALETASGQPVASIMDTWTKQMGYPVLHVATERSGGYLSLYVSQERFVYDQLLGEKKPDPQTWHVPITVECANGPTSLLMDQPEGQLLLEYSADGEPTSTWVKVNPGQTGFYRVNYSSEDWERLIPAIRSHELPATDRLGIQNDAYALSKAGLLTVTQFLSLARAYENEDDASVWSDLANNLRNVEALLTGNPARDAFRIFCRDLFAPAARRSGWEPQPGEGHLDALLRSTVLGQAGHYGDILVLNGANTRFLQYLASQESLHPDLRAMVFGLAGQTGDRLRYDQLWELEKEASLQEEKERLLGALTRFSQPELLQDALEKSLSSDVRSQNTIQVVIGVASNLRGRELAWEFVKSNWPEFDRRYGDGGFALMQLVSICGNFATEEKFADVKAFFEAHPVPAAERTIRQSLEQIRLNIRWLARNGEEVANWFDAGMP